MSAIVNTFNLQLINLATVLSKRFENDDDLKLAVTGIQTLKKANSNKNIEMFTMYVYKYREKNIDDCILFSEIEINILDYIDEYVENNINIIINELLIFLENDYYKRKYIMTESVKLGLILYLFKYKNLNYLKKNYNFKLLQKLGVLYIKKLKLEVEKEKWKNNKKRIEALNLELKLLKGIDKSQETTFAV